MLQTTMTLHKIDGAYVPFQNGIPAPSFEPQNRTVIPLAGTWLKQRFAADHDLSMAPRNAEWLLAVERREGKYLWDADTAGWQPHAVPLPENALNGTAEPGAAETYEDGVWYRRTFEVDAVHPDVAFTLKMLGASYVADVWLNGHWIGGHEGGFTPFAFDATPCIRQGMNDIRIRIDNPPWGSRVDTIPAVAGTDFFNYTGLIHDLYVEATPCAHIVRADIVPVATDGTLRMTVVVENRGRKERRVRLAGRLFEADTGRPDFLASPLASSIAGSPAATDVPLAGEVWLGAGETRAVRLETRVLRPKLWSAFEPNLYVAEFELASLDEHGDIADRFGTQFGIRTLRTEGTQILLNETPIFLAGIARHEEWPAFGRTAAWERIKDDLLQVRALNANMARTGHYPNHVYTYLLLDRLGLLAMSEIPLWQFETAHYEAQEKKRLADQMFREMVFSQYNRPSVVLWSTQNESKDVMLRLQYNRRIADDLRSRYDDGRLLTQSAAADQPGADDPSMEPLDVAGWTMYFGSFHGGEPYSGTRAFLEAARAAHPGKPILNTEFGHWTGERDAEEPMQLHMYEETLRALLESATVGPDGELRPDGCVAGVDFWILYDWYVNHNRWIDTFGAFHMDRRTAKAVAARIAEDYARLTGRTGGLASGAPRAAGAPNGGLPR